MSSDEPIFLVSMCGTPEEFLAAFRRYVDRHGLFVPTATPAPALHDGRFAITLVDGRVMIEGEAEVASSSPRPSALYGRTGMTLHFTAVDEPSKQALAALDKAKLSIKVTSQAAALEPRPSRLTESVQHPPTRATGAATDKTLALAECVVVGELAKLTPGRVGAKAAAATAKPAAKFAIPPIGLTGGATTNAAVGAAIKPLVQQEAHVSTQTGVPPGPGSTPTAATTPISTTSTRSPALVLDDGPSEATEVGPIVEEGIIQPSGPTLTTTAVIVSAPPSPEALAAAAMSGARVPIDEELETTTGGPPPMPPSAPAPIPQQPSAPLRAPLGAAGARPATSGTYSFTKPGAASRAGSEPGGGARATTAPLTSGATGQSPGPGSAARPSVPAIAPLPGRAATPAIPAPPGPAPRPSSHSLKNGSGTPSGPVVSPLGGPASGSIAASPAAPPTASPAAPPAASPPASTSSGPARRPSAHVIRNGQTTSATGQSAALRPSVPAISPVPAMAPAAAPATSAAAPRSVPTLQSASIASPIAGRQLDGAAPSQERAERGERSERSERMTSSQVRRTVLGIAATYVEPAPAVPPPSPEDAAAVPEAVHDSLFETPDPEPDVVEAIPHPSDQLATRREGVPRPPARPPAAAPPPRRRTSEPRAALDSTFDDSDARARADSANGGMNEVMGGRAPIPSLAKPGRAPTSQIPPVPTRPPSVPGRFGRASESVPAAPPQPDIDAAWGDAPAAAPRLVATPPSQPTMPIRPPIPPAIAGSGPVGGATRPGSIPAASPGGALTASLATPRPVDETFATVPTSAPSPGSSGLRSPGGLSARPPSERSGPLTSVPSVSARARPLTGGPHLSALDAEATEAIDTDDPDDSVFGAAIGPPSLVTARPAMGAAVATTAHQFSDTASVSKPLEAVSASRPQLPFASPGAAGSSNALDPVAAAFASAPSLEAPPANDDAADPSADADDDDDLDVELDGSPGEPPPAAGKREENASHARARQLAIDSKVEIDPALYAESAIDQSFEANFVLPGGEPPPPNWQPPPPQWDPASAGIAMPPPLDQRHLYGYQQPESSYSPGYDMAYPQHLHTGDQTALVMAPDVGRRRSFVIIGSTILVLLAGAGLYFFLDLAKHGERPPASTQPASGLKTSADGQEGMTPDGHSTRVGTSGRDGSGKEDKGTEGKEAGATAAITGDEPSGAAAAAAAKDCELLIESSPDGATVLFAGEKLGTTPFTATLPCNPVTLTFRKEGFAEVTEEHSPTAKGEPFSVTLEPTAAIPEKVADKPQMVELEISANPSNAQIKVGDRELARGQRKISVPAGVEVTVTISKGGKSASKSLTPTAANRKVSLVIKRGGRPRKAPSGGQPPNSLEDL